ncbi:MAG: OmpA family protein [bacterium]|nr:OmpA family protein [bacterium]
MNGSVNDFAPAISPDGSFMIFNSNRSSKYQDLFISHYKDGKWGAPQVMSFLNSPYNDEAPFLSPDGKTLFFSSDRDGSMEMPRDARNRIKVSFDLYWSKLVDGNWTSPEPLPGKVNSMFHEKTPALTEDGKTLYFARWSFGHIKGTKLMKAEFKNGEFVNAELLPAPFNTGYHDLALIPAEDLEGFFFSSVRDDSFGKWDLYFVSYKNGIFGKPVNLGENINSEDSELFLTRIDQRFFICSNREGGKGQFDIYSSFIFRKDKSFDTRAINFDFNSYTIKKESFPYLNALSDFLKKNKDLKLEIIGHTDLHGSVKFNNDLSEKRSKSVRDYLVKKGLDSDKFQVRGAGKSSPLVNKIGKGHDEKNRRTEFKLIK